MSQYITAFLYNRVSFLSRGGMGLVTLILLTEVIPRDFFVLFLFYHNKIHSPNDELLCPSILKCPPILCDRQDVPPTSLCWHLAPQVHMVKFTGRVLLVWK